MRRRSFSSFGACFTVAGLELLGFPVASSAQQAASPRRIGVLLALLTPDSKEMQAFRRGLREAGYVEGRDLLIEWRSANGEYDRLASLAADLVERKVEVIVADVTPATQAARRATSSIPIVMAIVADPVGSGVVASLAEPGGNVTGLSIMLAELSAKRLQLLKESIPGVTRIGVIWNPATPWHPKAIENLKGLAPSLGISLSFASVRVAEEIAPAVAALSQARAQALYVVDGAPLFNHRATFLRLAAIARLPVMSGERQYTDEGGLISYGPSYEDQLRGAAEYVDKILKGRRPNSLPIRQPTKFLIVINAETARVLNIAIPETLLLRADDVVR